MIRWFHQAEMERYHEEEEEEEECFRDSWRLVRTSDSESGRSPSTKGLDSETVD